jgi:hypothetical protein
MEDEPQYRFYQYYFRNEKMYCRPVQLKGIPVVGELKDGIAYLKKHLRHRRTQ